MNRERRSRNRRFRLIGTWPFLHVAYEQEPRWGILPLLLTLRQTASALSVHPNTVRLWDRSGYLRAIRIGRRRDRRYRKDEVMALWQRRRPTRSFTGVVTAARWHGIISKARALTKTQALKFSSVVLVFMMMLLSVQSQVFAESKRTVELLLNPSTCSGWSGASAATSRDLDPDAQATSFREDNSAIFDSRMAAVRSSDGGVVTGSLDGFSPSLVCDGFTSQVTGFTPQLDSLQVEVSLFLPSLSNSTAVFVLSSSVDGTTWTDLVTLPVAEPVIGTIRVLLPKVSRPEDLSPLKLRLTAQVEPTDELTAWVDGMALRARGTVTAGQASEQSISQKRQKQLDALVGFSQAAYKSGEQPVVRLPRRQVTSSWPFGRQEEVWSIEQIIVRDAAGHESNVRYSMTEETQGDDVWSALTVDPAGWHPGRYVFRVVLKNQDGLVNTVEEPLLWGVVALNLARPAAQPGQDQVISISLLDDRGVTICDAKLRLTVTDPKGKKSSYATDKGTVARSNECVDKGVTNHADYTIKLPSLRAGLYHLRLEADARTGRRIHEDSFEVSTASLFELERHDLPTRIYPLANYTARFAITPPRDYQGILREAVPADFDVSQMLPLATVRPATDGGSVKYLEWEVAWRRGQTYFFSYTFDAPDLSPALFTLGPLRLSSGFIEGFDFQEPRPWRLASDEVSTAGAFSVLPEEPADWNQDQPVVAKLNQTAFGADEVVSAKIWTKGFAIAGAGDKLVVRDVTVKSPSDGPPAFALNRHRFVQGDRTREVLYFLPSKDFRPGEYRLRLSLTDGANAFEQELPFEWGTLDLEATDLILTEKRAVNLSIHAFDDVGQPRCGGDVRLEVRTPSQELLSFYPGDGQLEQRPCDQPAAPGQPHATVRFVPTEPGLYRLRLTRADQDGQVAVNSTLEVTARKETPKKIKKSLDEAVDLVKEDFTAHEEVVVAVTVRDSSPFSFVGVGPTERSIQSVIVLEPSGAVLNAAPVERRRQRGDQTVVEYAIDPADFPRPGRYTVIVNLEQGDYAETIQQEFTWGVVAVNVRRSVGKPNTATDIGMAVLDDLGRTLCDATVDLEVTSPRRRRERFTTRGDEPTIRRDPACVDRSVTNDPDYAVQYTTADPGTYRLRVTAETKDGKRTVEDSFTVQASVVFDIERTIFPTRIYPVAEYPVKFTIVPRGDFKGTVIETMPASFKLFAVSGQAEQAQAGEDKVVTWTVDWEAGQTYELQYSFDAPDIAPEFYTLGPLQLVSENGQEVFRETRQWQIASDSVPTYQFTPTAGTLVTGTEQTITSVAASSSEGVNIGSWKGTLTDDNYHWVVAGTASGVDVNLTVGGVTLNNANILIVQTEFDLDVTALATLVQICDWVSTTSVDNAADAQCTGGGWRTLNNRKVTTISTTAGNYHYPIHDGYWSNGSNTPVSTPLTNFVNGSNQIKVRFYSTTNSTATIAIDYVRVYAAIHPTYAAASSTVISGTGSGEYTNTTIYSSGASDNVYYSDAGTVSTIADFYFSFKNVKTYTGMNTVVVRAEHGCNTSGLNYRPKIYNFNSAAWEDLTTTSIVCATDAANTFAKNNVTISNYISSGEIRVGWYGLSNSTVQIRIDMIYITLGTTNTDANACEISFGTVRTGTCANTRDIDTTATASTWDIDSEDESTNQGHDIYAYDTDHDGVTEEAYSAHVKFSVTVPTNAQATSYFFSSQYAPGTGIGAPQMHRDYDGRTTATGGFSTVGITLSNSTTLTWMDNNNLSITNGDRGFNGRSVDGDDHVQTEANEMWVRLATSSAGTTTNNAFGSWDFIMVSIQWVEDSTRPTRTTTFTPTGGTLVTGTEQNVDAVSIITSEGVNMGSWKGTLADDNLHWVVAGTAAGVDVQLNVGNAHLNGANAMLIMSEYDLDATALSTVMQICDWVSTTSVDNAADAQCTGGGWRTLNNRKVATTSTSPTYYLYEVYDGYWTNGSNSPVSTPLSNFVNSSKQIKIRYYATTNTTSTIAIDYLRIMPLVYPLYTPASSTVISGSGSGEYINTTVTANADDGVYYSVAGTVSTIADFYFSFKNVKTYTGMNTIVMRSNYGCNTSGLNYRPKIYNFNSAAWEDLTTTSIACATDATNIFAKNNVTIANYISNGEIRVGWYGLSNSTVQIRIDYIYLMVGTTNTDSGTCSIPFGTLAAGDCTNTRNIDTTATASTWDINAEDESSNLGHDYFSYDNDADANTEEAASGHLKFSVTPPANASITSVMFAGRYQTNNSVMSVQQTLYDYAGLSDAVTGGFARIGTATSNSALYTDPFVVNNNNNNGYSGWIQEAGAHVDGVNGQIWYSLRTTAHTGTTATNAQTNWDFAFVSLSWVQAIRITVSGTIYSDEGLTAYNCSTNNLTVALQVNGQGNYSNNCTVVGGTYSVSDVTIAAGSDVVTAFLDGETEKAVAITRVASTPANITDMHLYQNRVIVRHEDTGPITNSNLDYYDSGNDSDIQFTVTSGALTVASGNELHVWTGKTFDPGGDVDTNATSGDLHIDDNATAELDTATSTIGRDVLVDAGATFRVNANTDINGGDITTTTTGTVTTTAGTPTITISGTGTIGGGSGAITFYNLATTGTGTTTWSASGTNTSNNNVTVGAGTTLNLNSSVTVTGNLTNTTTGIIGTSSGTPTVTVQGTSIGGGSGAITIYNLTKSGAGTTTFSGSGTNTINNNLAVNAGTLTLSNTLTVTNDVAVATGATFNINANLNVNGGDLTNTGTGIINTTSATPTVTMSGTGNLGGVSGSTTFYNVTTTGTGTTTVASNIVLNNDLVVGSGTTLSGTNNVTVNGGDATGDGTINLTGGTFLIDAAGNFGGATGWTFSSLTFGDGVGAATTTATGAGGITVTGTMTIAANQTLSAGSKTYTLSGSGATPFSLSGTFTASSSTVSYTGVNGGGNVNVTTATYSGLTVNPSSTETYDVAGSFSVSGTLNVGTNATLSIASGQALTHSGATLTLNGTISGAGTYVYQSATAFPTGGTISSILRFDATNNAQTLSARTYGGLVEVYSNSTTNRTVTMGTAASQTLTFSGALNLKAVNSGDLTLDGDANDPTVNVTGDLDFTGTGGGTELLAAGTGTWTVSGNADFTSGIYAPQLVTLNPTLWDRTVYRDQQYLDDGFGGCTLNTTAYACNGLTDTTLTTGLNDTTIVGCSSPQDIFTYRSGLKFDLSTINNSAVVIDVRLGLTLPTTATTQTVTIGRSTSDTPDTASCTTAGGTFSAVNVTSTYATTTSFNSAGRKLLDFSATAASDIQSRIAGSDVIGLGLKGDETTNENFDVNSNDASADKPTLYVAYATGSPTLVMNGTSKTLTSADNTLYNLTLSGSIILANATHTVAGNLDMTSGTITAGSSTVAMVGGGKTITGAGQTLSGLTIDPLSAGTVTLSDSGQTNDLTVSGTVTVATGDTLSIAANATLLHSGVTLTLNGTISGSGTYVYQSSTTFPSGGTISSILRMDATNNNQTLSARTYGGAVEVYNNSSSLARTITAGTAGSQTLTFSSDLTVNAANTQNITLQGATWDPTINITGIFDFTGGGAGTEVVTAPDAAATWTVTGNVDLNGGTWTASAETLKMNGTANLGGGGNTVRNLTVDGSGNTVTLTGSDITVSGTLTLGGAADANNDTLTLASGRLLTLSGNTGTTLDIKNSGTDTVNGPGRLTYQNSATTFPTVGTLAATLITRFDTVNGAMTIPARTDYGAIEAYGGSANARTVTLGTATSQTITTSSYFYVMAEAASPNDVTVSATTNNPTVNVGLDLDFTGTGAANEIIQSGTGTWTVSGNVDFTGGTYTATSGNTLVMNGTTKTLTSASQTLQNVTLSGTITLANATHTVAGNLSMAGGTIIAGTSTVIMTGTSNNLTGGGNTLNNLTIDPSSAGTITLQTSDLTVSGALTVETGDTLSLNASRLLTHTGGTLTLNGTISGSGTLVMTDTSPGPGAVGGSTLSSQVRFDASNGNIASTTLDARIYGGAVELYTNAAGAPARTITFPTGTFTFSSTLTTNRANTGTITVDADTNDPAITVSGVLTIGGSTTFSASATGTFNVNGNYTNSGTFTDNLGTVTLAGSSQQTLSGTMAGTSNDFYNLTVTNSSGSDPDSSPSVIFSAAADTAGTFLAATANVKLRFNAGSTYAFTAINLNGQATTTRVKFRSSTGGTQFNFNAGAGARTVSNTEVKDSTACGSSGGSIDASDGTNFDAGNTSCWTIHTISFSASDNAIGFGSLSISTGRWATGDALGGNASAGLTPTAAHTLSVATSGTSGYAVTYLGSLLTSGANTVSAASVTSDSDGAPGNEQFGISASTDGNATIASGYARGTNSSWNFVADTTTTLVSESIATTTETISLSYLGNISSTTEAGSYSTTLTYIMTATY